MLQLRPRLLALVGSLLPLFVGAQALPSIRSNTHSSPVDYVNPLVGTLSSFELSTGNTYPVISRPWGMNSWTPQTGKMGDGWQYVYSATKLRGIKQTHQPSPWINDYGQFSLMPVVSPKPLFDEDARASWFSHKAEHATPYVYSVYLADYDTEVSLAPSERAAVMEIRYGRLSKPEERWLVIDAFDSGSQLRQLDDHHIVGYSTRNSGGVPKDFRNYIVLRTESPIQSLVVGDTTSKDGHHARLALRFASPAIEQRIWVASSFVSSEQAQHNLEEVTGHKLKDIADQGKQVWNDLLGRIDVQDSRQDKMATFYSCLYRSLLFPRRFYEIDASGDTIHRSPYNGKIERGYLYTDTGIWDTFRSLFPLINLIYPEEGARMQEGMLAAYKESGFFPEWASPGHRDCMVGNNSASVVADAFLKGLGRINTTDLVQGLLHGANAHHPLVKSTGRLGSEYYNKLGYVPCDIGIKESAARSLEYAYDDWCIWQVLSRMSPKSKQTKLYARRAQNYRNLYDASTGWMRGKTKSGAWQTPFNPYKWGDAFTEGNALHYTWSVFHDVAGLIELMGGEEAFVQRLDSIFRMPPIFDDSYYGFPIHEIREMQVMNMGNYAHGNQPIQHMLYLYAYAGAPYKGQERIREVMNRLYSSQPDGYCGDEDNGQTSAWYVFSALGFYPVTPASDQYVLGVPYFERVTIALPNGKSTRIQAQDVHYPFVQSLTMEGKSYDKCYITYQDLRKGIDLNYKLGAQPSTWGTKLDGRPYSMSKDKALYSQR